MCARTGSRPSPWPMRGQELLQAGQQRLALVARGAQPGMPGRAPARQPTSPRCMRARAGRHQLCRSEDPGRHGGQVDRVTAVLASGHTPTVLLAAGVLLENPWPRLRQARAAPLELAAPWARCSSVSFRAVRGAARGLAEGSPGQAMKSFEHYQGLEQQRVQ